ncbi:MAG: Gldg family protein [Pseudomonadota bacterium]
MNASRWLKRSNAIIILVASAGILILLNAFSAHWFARVDLTANNLNSLSPYSIEVIDALGNAEGSGELLVKMYASQDLPDREKASHGRERDIRGVEQQLRDILEEYRARSNGRMLIETVEEDVETRAEEAGLEPFVGEKTELTEGEKGQFEMKRYYLGVTLHYRGVMEVVPKALEPGLYEYELTRAMIRLRDKVQDQRRLEEMFRIADELKGLASGCHDQVTAYTPSAAGGEQLSGIEGLLNPIENPEQEVEALIKNRALVQEACQDLLPRFEAVQEQWAGKHRRFDAFLNGDTHDAKLKGGLEGLAYAAQKLVEVLSGDAPTPKDVGQWKDAIVYVKGDLDVYHKELKDSAGQQKLGFLCGRRGFCPVPTETPIFSDEAMRVATMKNQQFARLLQYHAGMEQQLRQILLRNRNQLFRRQDFDVVRVEAGTPISDEIQALVIFGVRGVLTAVDRYWIDQYLLDGGTVIVFAQRYDVNLGLFSQDSYIQADRRGPPTPDRHDVTAVEGDGLDALLGPWGVTIEPSLLMDPTHTGKISLPHRVRKDNKEDQGTMDFDYPLFVHTTEMDQESVLVRSLPGIVLPFASPLRFEAPAGAELQGKVLVTASDQAVAFPHPERYWLWSAALAAQEQTAKAATRAWNLVAKNKAADAAARVKAGKDLKRVVRTARGKAKGAAEAFRALAVSIAAADRSDGNIALTGKAKDLLKRLDDVGVTLSAAEDGDLDGIARSADTLMGLATESRTELSLLAWKAWTEAFGAGADGDEPPKIELIPSSQVDLAARMEGKGPRTLVLLVEGEFPSAFAKGKDLPIGLTDAQKKDRLVSGPGRLLVIGSDLGLKLPDPEWVFEGIDPADFVPGPAMVQPQLRVANWQIGIGQVERSLSMDGIPFLLNTLDWAVQRVALADIRAKQNPLRRIRTLENEGSRTMMEIGWIGGLPLVFLLFGLGFWQWRNVRRRRLRDRFAALGGAASGKSPSHENEEISE